MLQCTLGSRCRARQKRPLELLAKCKPLALIIRADPDSVDRVRPGNHRSVQQAANNLPVLDEERDFMRSHFEHRARDRNGARAIAEAWIEEASVMYPKLTHGRIERYHLGGKVRRNPDPFF